MIDPAGFAVRSRLRIASAPLRVASGLALAVAADVVFDPAHTHVPLCPFKAVTGFSCPLCGGLRCVNSLVRTDVVAATRANLLVLLAVPFLLGYWLDWVWRERVGRPRRPIPLRAIAAVVVLAAVFTIVRNLPAFGDLRGL
jgi:hypothetical protein